MDSGSQSETYYAGAQTFSIDPDITGDLPNSQWRSAVPGVEHPEGRVVGEVEMPGPPGLAPAADMAQQAGALDWAVAG